MPEAPKKECQEITELFGAWGRSQKYVFTLMMVTGALMLWHMQLANFLVPLTRVICIGANSSSPDGCKARYSHLPEQTNCSNWEYQRNADFDLALTEKFNLVCDRAWMISFIKSIPMVAAIISSLFVGPITDRYGRKKSIIIFLIPGFVGDAIILATQNVTMLIIGQVIVGISFGVVTGPVVVLLSEISDTKRRTWLGCLSTFGCIFGSILLGSVGWIFRNWFYVQLLGLCLTTLTLPLLFFIPESPSWLIVQNRQDDAINCINSICKKNAYTSPYNIPNEVMRLAQLKLSTEETRKYDFWDLVKTPEMLKRTLIGMIVRFSFNFLYCGVSMNILMFSENFYQNFLLSCTLSLPFSVVGLLLVRKLSLKKVLCLSSLGATLTIFAFGLGIVLGFEAELFKTFMVVISWGFLQTGLDYSVQFIPEIFPTVVRGSAMSLASIFARTGGSISIYFQQLSDVSNPSVALFLFGAIGLLCLICCIISPETKDQQLKHTIFETEHVITKRRTISERHYNFQKYFRSS